MNPEENASENEQTVENQTSEATQTTNQPANDSLGDGGKKALDSERKRANDAEKALRAALARIKELEDADKSELEKLNSKLSLAEKAASEADAARAASERNLLAVQAAVKAGLSPDVATRLQGETLDDLVKDAKELAKQVAPTGPRKPAPVEEAGKTTGAAKDKKQLFADAISASFGS